MKRISTYFVNGIITIVPIVLVIYVIVQTFKFLDNLLGRFLKAYGSYVPGIGLLLTLILITVVGWLATQYLWKSLIQWVESIFTRIPFIKTLYKLIKETIQSLFGEKRSFSKVALIRMPGTSMRVVGFITSEEVEPLSERLKGHIAVYIPQSFQVAGVTVLVPKEDVEILDISAEDAMRFIMSAGVSGSNGSRGEA